MAEELPKVPAPEESVDAGQAHPGDQARPEAGYERSDVNVRGVLVFGAGVAAALALISLLLAGLFHLFWERGSAEEVSDVSLLQQERAEHPSPQDRLPATGIPGDPSTREPRLEGIDPELGQRAGPPANWPAGPLRSGVPGRG